MESLERFLKPFLVFMTTVLKFYLFAYVSLYIANLVLLLKLSFWETSLNFVLKGNASVVTGPCISVNSWLFIVVILHSALAHKVGPGVDFDFFLYC